MCIIDSSDPNGSSSGLFSKEFYRSLKLILRDGAWVSQQCDTNEKNYLEMLTTIQNNALKYVDTQKYPTDRKSVV